MGQRKEPGMDFDLNVVDNSKSGSVRGDVRIDLPDISTDMGEHNRHTDVRSHVKPEFSHTRHAVDNSLHQVNKPSSRMPWALAIVSFLGMIGLAVWVAVVMQTQQAIKRELSAATENIDAIGGALNSQGETILSKGNQTQEKLKFLESEVRKLWVVANERNKKSIQDLQGQIAALEKIDTKLAKDTESSVKQLETNSKRLEDFALNQQQTQVAIAALEESVVDLRALLQANAETMAQLDEVVKTFAEQDMGQTVGRLSSQLDDLSKQMLAVDAHRRQVNRLLEQLDTEIRTLKAQP